MLPAINHALALHIQDLAYISHTAASFYACHNRETDIELLPSNTIQSAGYCGVFC